MNETTIQSCKTLYDEIEAQNCQIALQEKYDHDFKIACQIFGSIMLLITLYVIINYLIKLLKIKGKLT